MRSNKRDDLMNYDDGSQNRHFMRPKLCLVYCYAEASK